MLITTPFIVIGSTLLFAQPLDDTENTSDYGCGSGWIVLLFWRRLRSGLGLANNAAIAAAFKDFYITEPTAMLSAALSPGLP